MPKSEEIIVDISTRFVGPEEDIYVVRPGEGYWLYDDFARSSHVFLDFPALELDFKAPPPADRTLREMIVRSLTIGSWISDGKIGRAPSRDLKDYVGKDYRFRLGRYVGATRRLYYELKPGTIVVVPGKEFYEEVLIGEIVGESRMISRKHIYDNEPIPARKVKWLRRRQRSTFSSEMRDRFGRPDPIMLLDRSLRGEILRAGFDQYAFAGEFVARLNTEEDDFNTLDDYNIQTFVNYVTGVLVAQENGHTTKLSMAQAIKFLRQNPERAAQLAQNINSKGFQRLVDDTVVPITVALLLTVAMDAPAGSSPPSTVTVANSANSGNDPCRIEVQQRVAGALSLMKLDEWRAICESARDVRRSTGLSTTMGVTRNRQGRRSRQ